MTLAAKGISVRYRGAAKPSLHHVDLVLQPGQLLVVAGPNGSGKTTLQRALLGLVPLTEGEVTLDGRPMHEWPRRAIADRVGALPQREEPAFPLSVAETVLLGRWAHLGPMAPVTDADASAVAQAMDRCDVANLATRDVDTLSGGEWQRVRVARALAAAPKLLVLDEPTAALDISHEMELFELLRSLVAEGLGILVITHQLNLAIKYASTVILLDHGRIAASGSPASALTSERLSTVFGWPIRVTADFDGTTTIAPTQRTPQHRSDAHLTSTEGQAL